MSIAQLATQLTAMRQELATDNDVAWAKYQVRIAQNNIDVIKYEQQHGRTGDWGAAAIVREQAKIDKYMEVLK